MPTYGPFTPATFDLLARLRADPSKRFYDSHKDALKIHVQEPFQRVLRRVASGLPSQIRTLMETKEHLFSHFLKNDFGQGHAWDYYWGAFYTRGGSRMEGAQLYLWIDCRILKYGFFIGEYAHALRNRFWHNARSRGSILVPYLRRVLPDAAVIFGGGDRGADTPIGGIDGAVFSTWEGYLRNPGRGDNEVCLQFPSNQVLGMRDSDLVAAVKAAHRKLFPLVLLAVYPDPLPEIRRYLGPEL